MHVRTRSQVGVAATGVAIVGITAMTATLLGPAPGAQSGTAVPRDVRLTATEVPPGGLITSFLRNQVINCSAICPPLINVGVTAALTTLQTPVTSVGALQSGNILKAIGIIATSVTDPTNAALGAAIDADATVAVPRASNTFEVAVVGLLNVVPAAAGGLPGIFAALQTVRQDTFEALNSPVGAPPAITAMPQGVVEVAAISAIHVGEAVIFPAFNDALQATVGVPNAAAKELAASGDPVRSVAAGVNSAVGSVTAATNVVAASVVNAVKDIRATSGQSAPAGITGGSPLQLAGTPKHSSAETGGSHSLSDFESKIRQAARSAVNSTSIRPLRIASSKSKG
jgi:hypothetical protein